MGGSVGNAPWWWLVAATGKQGALTFVGG